jgi:hypothetical protein
MTRLTPDDVEWLEQRLQRAVRTDAVRPDPAFVSRAHDELMHAEIAAARRSPTTLLAVAFAFSALAAALLLLMRRRSAPSSRTR